MIEVIAGLFVTCFVLSWIVTGLFLVSVFERRFKSKNLQTLNLNLQKIGLLWSLRNDEFVSQEKTSINKDRGAARRSILMMTALFSLLSVLGFICNLIMLLSLGFLARSRREIEVLSSQLSMNPNLAPSEVRQQVRELREMLGFRGDNSEDHSEIE